jgi:hypothetical protein
VALDLAGHTLTGMMLGASAGVELLPGAVHATVESTQPGGAVRAFHAGIQDYASNAVIEGPYLLLTDNVGAGVYLYRVTASLVQDAHLSGNHHFGANIQQSRDVVLRDDQVDGNAVYGIWAQSSMVSQLTQDRIDNSGLAGIYLGCSDTANLQDVGCRPSDGSLIEGNVLVNNGPLGIAIADQSLANQVDGNTATADTRAGLWDENFMCAGLSLPPNSWRQNTGSRNQSASATCIG